MQYPEFEIKNGALIRYYGHRHHVTIPEGVTVIGWVEEIGYFWHKNPYDREKIEELLFDPRVSVEWNQDQSFRLVPYNIISDFMNWKPLVKKKRE